MAPWSLSLTPPVYTCTLSRSKIPYGRGGMKAGHRPSLLFVIVAFVVQSQIGKYNAVFSIQCPPFVGVVQAFSPSASTVASFAVTAPKPKSRKSSSPLYVHYDHRLSKKRRSINMKKRSGGKIGVQNSGVFCGLPAESLAWTGLIVFVLAESLINDPADILNGRELGFNLLDAALPLTATDAVAVTIGEVVAGTISPFVTLALVRWLPSTSNGLAPARDLGQTVADADFLVVRAATQPVLSGIGLPPLAAKVLGGLLALIPSEFVKSAVRLRDDSLRDEIHHKEQMSRVETSSNLFSLQSSGNVTATTLPVKARTPLVVEVFSDLLKWLSYGVMCTRFEGALTPLTHVPECAIFGVLANVGSQAYVDWMEYSFLGNQSHNRIKDRLWAEWRSLYLSHSICGATLFGLYEWVEEPATTLVSAFLEG